jgi:hypothetical protein
MFQSLTDFWSLPIRDEVELLVSRLDGLTKEEASRRLKLYG